MPSRARLGRAAIVTAGATLLAVSGCVQAVYGAPTPGIDGGAPTDGPADGSASDK